MDIGKQIRKYRKEAGLSQKELGKKLGVSQQHIAQYENGKRVPKMETIQKLSDALNVQYSALMDLDMTIKELDKFELYTAYLENIGCEITLQATGYMQLIYTLSYKGKSIDLDYNSIHKMSDDAQDYIKFKLEQLMEPPD